MQNRSIFHTRNAHNDNNWEIYTLHLLHIAKCALTISKVSLDAHRIVSRETSTFVKEFFQTLQGLFKKALDVLFTTKYTEFHGVLLSYDCEADESYARIIISFQVCIQRVNDDIREKSPVTLNILSLKIAFKWISAP